MSDIGELLRRPQATEWPEMAPMSDGISSSNKISADGEHYYVKVPTRPVPPKPLPAAKSPVMEDTLWSLMDELRWNIATNTGRNLMESRMLNALFSARQAKAMPLDRWYRIPKPATITQSTSRDTIVRIQQSQDRLAFMAAIRNRSPFQFEEHLLTFFPDLSRATLEWRHSQRPLTKELIAHKIP
ncbi:Hypothetical predicted protein [Pelobates cultripes]|uniref:Uncharacterized protein n=1 Tax=Pelobates cultripes TaxID=61616 RepID=A0AAD1RTI2_PELCU|nr:Hypothetical predicted protein [Pelobates cultripes]